MDVLNWRMIAVVEMSVKRLVSCSRHPVAYGEGNDNEKVEAQVKCFCALVFVSYQSFFPKMLPIFDSSDVLPIIYFYTQQFFFCQHFQQNVCKYFHLFPCFIFQSAKLH